MLADVTGAQKFLTFYSVTTRRATYKGRPQDILFWELHYDVTGHLSAQEWEALEPAIDPVNMLANLAETSRPLDIPAPNPFVDVPGAFRRHVLLLPLRETLRCVHLRRSHALIHHLLHRLPDPGALFHICENMDCTGWTWLRA